MKSSLKSIYALAIALAMVVGVAGTVSADNNPIDENWWPSEFGIDDERGAINYMNPCNVLAAIKLVKKGRVANLGNVYHNHMPLVPGRTFALSIPGGPTHYGPSVLTWPGDAFQQTFMDELLIAEIGQVGTQFDGLGHPLLRVTNSGNPCWPDGDYMYNKKRLQDYHYTRGLPVNGVQNVGNIVTRGIMIDAAALKGVDMMTEGQYITLADHKAALKRQGIADVGKGEVVIYRTGYNKLWVNNMDNAGNLTKSPDEVAKLNKRFASGEPGVAPELCDYLADIKIVMIASDVWGLEPYPNNEEEFAYCHINLVTRRGIYNFENLNVEQLHNEKVYEFMFAWGVLRLQGATGAPGNPLAIY